MRILVAGAGCFLGRVLARRLSRDHQLLSLGETVEGAVAVPCPGHDPIALRRALEGVQVVLHLAPELPGLLEAAAWEGVKRVVWIGVPAPPEVDIPGVVLEPATMLGPGHPAGVPPLVGAWVAGRVDRVPTGTLSFVDVRDVGAAVEAAMSRDVLGERLGLASATWTLARFFETLATLTERAPPHQDPEPWTAGRHVPELAPTRLGTAIEASRATEVLGWWHRSPERTLLDTLG